MRIENNIRTNDQVQKALDINYKHYRDVALGTGIPALTALIAAVVLAILFPPVTAVYTICVPILAIAATILSLVSLGHGIQAARIQHTNNLFQATLI